MTEQRTVQGKKDMLEKVRATKREKDRALQKYIEACVSAKAYGGISYGEIGIAAGVDRSGLFRLIRGAKKG